MRALNTEVVTLKQTLEHAEVRSFISKLAKSKSVKDIILFGGLRKVKRTTKDIDLLIVGEKTKFPSSLKAKLNGYIHYPNIHEIHQIPYPRFKRRGGGVKYLGFDLWETDMEHQKLAMKRLGIRKPFSLIGLVKPDRK